jgi:hypothetical protein
MHGSGTSWLTGALQRHGLFVGVREGEESSHPLRENAYIAELHDDILTTNGGAWDDPPAIVEWEPRHFDRAGEILSTYASHPLWGFKDPRTLLTFDGWKQLLPDLELVGIIRHPLRVVTSLTKRTEARPALDPLDLWQVYNGRLLEIHSREPFPLVNFDDDASELATKIPSLAENLGLEREPRGEPFFSEQRRRAQPAEGPLAPDAEGLYKALVARAI